MKKMNLRFCQSIFCALAIVFLTAASGNFANATSPTVVSEIHITKWNGGIGALFNRYRNVSYSRVPGGASDGGARVDLLCTGRGWAKCEYTGYSSYDHPEEITPDQWATVIETANELSLNSEVLAREEEEYTGSDSQVLAMEKLGGGTIYFIVTAQWSYCSEDPTTGEVFITITMTEDYPPQ